MFGIGIWASDNSSRIFGISSTVIALGVLAWLGGRNYLLFHSLAELFSIIVAAAVFMIAWNVRDTLDNGYLQFLGTALLFIAAIDLVHTLAYNGMGVFPGYGTDLPTQLWIAGRALESLSLLIAPVFLTRRIRPLIMFSSFIFFLAFILLSTFTWHIFPTCYIEGRGLTDFKIIMEYVICFILVLALIALLLNRARFQKPVLYLLCSSILATILSELAFTKYASVYGNFNLIGHLLKIVSVVFVYKAIVETGLRRPYDLLYRSLAKSERKFRSAIESNMIGVVFADPFTGEVTEANDEYLRIVGRTRADLDAGKVNWKAMTPAEVLAWEEAAISSLAPGTMNVHSYEKEYTRPDGTRVPVIIGGAFLDDTERRMVAYVLDNTARKLAEEAMRESEQRYRSFVEASSQIVWTANPFGEVNLEIPAWQSYTGQTAEQARGFGWMDVIHPDDRERVAAAWAKASESNGIYEVEYRLRRHDETWRNILARGVPVVAASGKIQEYVGTCIDITERKRTEEALRFSEEKFTKAFANNAAAIAITRLNDGLFLDVNETWVQLMGYTREEAIGHYARIMNIWPDMESAAKFVDELRKNGTLRGMEQEFHKKSGQVFVAQLSAQVLTVRGETVILSTLVDITDRKKAEQAVRESEDRLRVLNEILEKRVEERTAELERRALQLRQLASDLTLSEQRERQRLAMVLHDGLQQVLVAAKFRTAFLERAGDLHQAAMDISNLIDDGIETSRSLTAELSPPILYQGGLIPGIEWLANWMHDKHGLSVNLIVREQIGGLPEELTILLFHALRELLFNVVKHAGVKASRVEVTRLDGRVQVEVTDRGVGFDVRKPYSKEGSSGGMGLFSINERLSYLGGRMEVDSTPGKGSRFRLITPLLGSEETYKLQKPAEHSISVGVAGEGADRTKPTEKIRAVLVDDHMVMRQGLAGLLRAERDIEIVGEASDGESAIDIVRRTRPDVVLMDIGMPKMDGIKATQIIHQEMPYISIIGLSMFQEEDRAMAICQAGAVKYLAKTGPSEAVIKAIRFYAAKRAQSAIDEDGNECA